EADRQADAVGAEQIGARLEQRQDRAAADNANHSREIAEVDRRRTVAIGEVQAPADDHSERECPDQLDDRPGRRVHTSPSWYAYRSIAMKTRRHKGPEILPPFEA